MPYYLTKILPLFLMPVSIVIGATILALCFTYFGKRKSAMVSLLLAISLLWISAMPIVAVRLTWSLQSQYPPVAMEEISVKDCIIVLGGALGGPDFPRVDIELTDASDRIYQTAKLYRAGKARTIIVAAGNQPWDRSKVSEAQLISDLLVEWGVPRQAIVREGASKNTRENAINAAAVLDTHECQSSLLVTSSSHMPRSLAAFRMAGAEVVPFSVDVMSFGENLGAFANYIPQAGALAATSAAIREWLGIWVYRWRGWN